MRKFHLVLLVAACFICLSAVTASANLVLNGSFELPVLTQNTQINAVPDSWNTTGPASWIFSYPGLAQSGTQYYDLGNSSAYNLSQSIMVTTAGTYTLGWFSKQISSTTAPFTVSFEGDSVNASQTFTPINSWRADSLGDLSLVAGTYTLTFTSGYAGGYDTVFIDNVTLTSTSPVPIPAAVWLLGSGLLGLIGARRFRK